MTPVRVGPPSIDGVKRPRLRFAPAPTGYLHIGSARTALFNWLYARHTGGELVLRIEDTNAELARPELIDNIYRSLEWLGIDWDGEVVRQSTRADLYAEAVQTLLDTGQAYEDEGAVRFRVPGEGTTSWDDVIRGTVSFENSNIEDFVIRRSDGSATFFVANAVDDVDLGITHVVRGEDLVNVTPKVLLLRHALGHDEDPVFAHLPLIVNERRKKLSKRRDDVALEDYRSRGFLPEAMVNYLALLGWGPPDGVEIRPVAEIVELFELTDINKAPAAFDIKKLTHINGEYIRALSTGEFLQRVGPWLEEGPWSGEGAGHYDEATMAAVAPLVRERIKTLDQVTTMVDFLFLDEPEIDAGSWAKAMVGNPAAAEILAEVETAFAAVAPEDWRAEKLHATLLAIGEGHGLKLGKAQAPVRVAVTGRTVGPPLFEALELLGPEVTIERLARARRRLAEGWSPQSGETSPESR